MRGWLVHRPVTLALATTMAVLAVVAGTLAPWGSGTAARHHWGWDPEVLVHGQVVPGLLAGILVPHSPLHALLAVVGVLVVIGAAEPRLGPLRTVGVFAATGVAGSVVGVLLQVAGFATRTIVPGPPMTLLVLDPTIPLAGVALALSAVVGPLWRRRIRVLGFAALAVAMLYWGGPADLYRVVAAIVGLLLGLTMATEAPRATPFAGSHREARSLVAVLVGITAAGPLASGLAPHGWGLLRPTGQLVRSAHPAGHGAEHWCHLQHPVAVCAHEFTRLSGVLPGVQLVSVLPLLVLVLAAIALWRGYRVGAIVAVAVELLYAVLGAVYFDLIPLTPGAATRAAGSITLVQAILSVALPLAVAALVVLQRRHFTVSTTRGVGRAAAAVAGLSVLGSAVASLAVAWFARAQFSPVPGLGDLLGDLPERFVPLGFLRLRRADFVPTGPVAHQVWAWTGPVAWTGVALAVALCLIAVRDRAPAADIRRARRLLQAAPGGPLAGMALWPGNRLWFTADGEHAVAYRPVGTVALAISEPLGAEEGSEPAARDFARDCEDRGLTPVFYTVRPAFAERLTAAGTWRTMPIGEDSVIRPATFSMTGKRWADVRSSFNRAERLGVRAVWTDWAGCSPARRAQIEAISEDWAAQRALPEMSFTLGGLRELKDRDTRLLLAVGPDDRIEAVTSWLPTWRDGKRIGSTLDMMRRRIAA